VNDVNTQFVLRSRPVGLPKPDDFEMTRVPLPRVQPGTFLVRNTLIGLAPASRIRMGDGPSYAAPTPLGSVIYSQSLGEVIESAHRDFLVGDIVVLTDGGWQTHVVSDGSSAQKVDTAIAPASVWLGALGVSGLTAYAGLMEVAGLTPADTLLVSAASGAVGSSAGQIAKAIGCRVVGIAGGARKVAHVRDTLGFDDCLDYRSASFAQDMEAAGGFSVYFDNVGGAVRDAALGAMADYGRIVVCGLISEYNDGCTSGPGWMPILTRRLTVRGFLMRDHMACREAFLHDMAGWLREGRIKVLEDVTEGFENLPSAFIAMLTGRNFGKSLVKLR
jgi:NADPH-dependent curcumin reductase CurA